MTETNDGIAGNQDGRPTACESDPVMGVVRRYWGFDALRDQQAAAIRAGIERQDSLVVLPTGGGKSLCYQVPPAAADRTDVVVSPLISLMRDQVDGLQSCGYPAAAIHSHLTPDEKRGIWRDLHQKRLRLLFVSPERLFARDFLDRLVGLGIKTFAVDEAHCISHWGHDFRPEYRRLAEIRQRHQDVALHAFTATATPRVREDIRVQLGLRDPVILVGSFDRPNLTYRVVPRMDVREQVTAAVKRHANEAAIVYCLSRKDTESMAQALVKQGVKAEAYHAGLSGERRHRVQQAFSREEMDVVCATVAFGMGIDRGDVRLVVHAAMPKSVEHYQQETGRAGRDGLPAECILIHSPVDAMKWEALLERSPDGEPSPEVLASSLELLRHMRQYAGSMTCRHKYLVEYFGQKLHDDNCGACDVCLGEVEGAEDATELARKIISCVYRVGECFGVGHVVDVLMGSMKESVTMRGHDQLSTHGLLRDDDRKDVQHAVYQLIEQGLVSRDGGQYPTLSLNEQSWEILRNEQEVRLLRAPRRTHRRTRREAASWEGVDRGLFERLRAARRTWAADKGVPPFVIMSDATLRDLARLRPRSKEQLIDIHGIGQKKQAEYGTKIVTLIAEYVEGEPA